MFSAFIGTVQGSGDRDALLQNTGTEKVVVLANVEVQAHCPNPEQASIPPDSQRHVHSPSQSVQVRKPAEVVDVDMHDSTSVADLVVEVEEEHCDQNLLSLDMASEQGRSGFRDPSEEQYSPTLTETLTETLTKQGTIPIETEAQADAEDVPVNEGAEMLHGEGGTDALSHPQAL